MNAPESRSSASGSFFASRRFAAVTESRHSGRRRWLVAIGLSIALNEIAIGVLRLPAPSPEAPAVKAERIVLERPRPTPRPTARPTPHPTPRPTPRPVVVLPPRATVAPVPQIAAAKAAGTPAPVHGGAPAKPIQHFKNFDIYRQLEKNRLRLAAGAGVSGTGAGLGTGSASGGGARGAGAGNGAAGSGTGGVNANTPCGEVIFNVRGTPDYHGAAATERVVATVQFPDGHTETDTFPYPWTYANGERDDPWSSTNLANQNLEPPLIFPPPGTDTRAYPPLIRYILDHTRPDGTTVLQSCPNQTPLPAH